MTGCGALGSVTYGSWLLSTSGEWRLARHASLSKVLLWHHRCCLLTPLFTHCAKESTNLTGAEMLEGLPPHAIWRVAALTRCKHCLLCSACRIWQQPGRDTMMHTHASVRTPSARYAGTC